MEVRTLDEIDVASLAKVVGVIGFLWGLVLSIAWLVVGALGGPFPGAPELLIATVGSLVAGIVVGGVTAVLYNAAAGLTGGLELELSDAM